MSGSSSKLAQAPAVPVATAAVLNGRHWTDQRWFKRFLEIVPGTMTYSILILPVVFSLTQPILVAYFIIAYDLFWTIKSFRLSLNLIRGYRRLHQAQQVDWNNRLTWLKDPETHLARVEAELVEAAKHNPGLSGRVWWRTTPARKHYTGLEDDLRQLRLLVEQRRLIMDPDRLYHAVVLATFNEGLDILEPSVKSLTEVDYPVKQIMLIIAFEERGGPETEANAAYLIKTYGHHFAFATAVKHPVGLPGEVVGKGGNISFAGRQLTEEVRRMGVHPEQVVVTTFDSDHRASKNYFSYLSYLYASDPNRVRKSFQPVPMFYNNIWDAPAPMRVIATGNTFWMLMETMRPHRLRNFAAHAQSLAALIATDYWATDTIVEDGRQYWRTYFTYDGDHNVVPIFTPIFQDAVLAETYPKTIRAQYKQLRRWAWGASDFAYAVPKAITNRRIPWSSKLVQMSRILEGHVSWATAPLILTFVGYLPLYLNPRTGIDALPHQLPIITSHIMQVASVGIFITILISMISLPPRPARYKRRRSVWMVAQWVLLPFTSIAFGSLAAIESQTRLILGRYLDFYVTEKATKK